MQNDLPTTDSQGVTQCVDGDAQEQVPETRKSDRQLGRELGISHKTVGSKRARGLSDQEIADEAEVLSVRHHPLKRKLEILSTGPAVQPPVGLGSSSSGEELGGGPPTAPEFILAPLPPAAPLGAMAEASLRKEQAEARLKELRLEEEEGRLVDLEVVGQEISRLVRETRDNMLGMAARLAPRLGSISDERQIYLLMTDEIEQSLHAVTKAIETYAEAA